MERFYLGMIDELPAGSPLEVPLHQRKRRCLEPADPPGYWQSLVTSDVKPSVAGPSEASSTESDAGPTPGRSDAVLKNSPSSPAVKVKCRTVYTPRASSAERQQQKRRRLRFNEKNKHFQYGSEDEEEEEPWDEDTEPMVPRALRMFFDADEDTPDEAEAADCVDAEVAEIPPGEGALHEPSSLFNFDWRSMPSVPIPPEQRREKFVGNSGPVMEPTTNPYDIFIKIWDRSIMEHIVAETNLYAQEYAAQLLDSGLMGPTSRISDWVDTNVGEMYVYFAIILAMGIVFKSKLEEYWNKDNNIFSTPYFSSQMSLRRFQLLSRCLHFNNNSHLSEDLTPQEAKIFKVAPIVDHLNSKFSSLYNMNQNVALDESLTQWKGLLNIKQYIPNKKSLVGIKTYEVCESYTGYLWRFEIHAGAVDQIDGVGIINGSIPNLVLRLLRGLEHSGRTIWMDNYYNSPALARVLKTLGLDCVGTLRTNRQFVPNEIADLKLGDMREGEVCGCTSGDVDLMVWRDHNRVAMISTYHGIAASDSKPTVVRDYNVCMGGVDRKDQMLSAYPIERKRTSVWYKKFFKRLLNVSVLNAYIIAKAFDPKIEHREFRQNLILELLNKHKPQPPQPPQPTPEPLSVFVQPLSDRKLSPAVLSHFPDQTPLLAGRTNRNRRLCVYCKTRQTAYFCKKCNKSLCFGSGLPCYIQYHS